eukprot:PhM_4_TR13556/c0_g1_i1/m.1435/K13985/NAPEPLD; N-acyl-phosphatidylethanolamine-hydrolysing phospholipase D
MSTLDEHTMQFTPPALKAATTSLSRTSPLCGNSVSGAVIDPVLIPRVLDRTIAKRLNKKGSGAFENPFPDTFHLPVFKDVMKWKMCGSSSKPPKPPKTEAERDKLVPRVDPKVVEANLKLLMPETTAKFTWMGHASYLIQYPDANVNILTDPIWSERCSIVQFAGPKRITRPPVDIDKLPKIDYIFITHNHYDHLDYGTLRKLCSKHNPVICVPIGMKAWFASNASSAFPHYKTNVVEFGWWDSCVFGIGPWWLRVVAVPGQHWTNRTMNVNHELWCGFVVEFVIYRAGEAEMVSMVPKELHGAPKSSNKEGIDTTSSRRWTNVSQLEATRAASGSDESLPPHLQRALIHKKMFSTITTPTFSSSPTTKRIVRWYHTGDTGYNDKVFRQIGDEFSRRGNRIDVCLMPIGAYAPRWFMRSQHMNPEDAVQAHLDVGAKASLSMHWGTFILTDEPIDEPPKFLNRILKERDREMVASDSQFHVLALGETYVV